MRQAYQSCPTQYTGISTDDFFPHRVEHDLRRIVQIQLLHQIRAMAVYRVGAELQSIRDLLVRIAFRKQLKHLPFSFCKQIPGIVEVALLHKAHVIFEQSLGDGGTEEWLAL